MMHRDYILAELRLAAARVRVIQAAIENIGTALKTDEITAEVAVAMIVTENLTAWCSERFEDVMRNAQMKLLEQGYEARAVAAADR